MAHQGVVVSSLVGSGKWVHSGIVSGWRPESCRQRANFGEVTMSDAHAAKRGACEEDNPPG